MVEAQLGRCGSFMLGIGVEMSCTSKKSNIFLIRSYLFCTLFFAGFDWHHRFVQYEGSQYCLWNNSPILRCNRLRSARP